jgi:2-polyprenyl-3-methyl-5-hydroxy-6-metoxy-1,4-benzoquinol methylase
MRQSRDSTTMSNADARVVTCTFCGGSRLSPFATATYWTVVPLAFDECEDCGLVFCNPMPGLDIIVEGNRALDILQPTRGTYSQYRGGWDFAFWLRKFRHTGTLLDIGCAQGFFLKGVEGNSDWRAEGLDIIDSMVTFARTRLGLTVHQGTLDTFPEGEARYDMLRMNNVIEHVQDPGRFLRHAYALLKPGGRVYCSTPNGIQDGAILRVANRRGFKMNMLENHFHLLMPHTLRNMFEAVGFRVYRHYLRDVSHTLSDFGITPGILPAEAREEHSLDYYQDKSAPEFAIHDDEILSYPGRLASSAPWRRVINALKTGTTLHLPTFARIGHQQYLYAEKPADAG